MTITNYTCPTDTNSTTTTTTQNTLCSYISPDAELLESDSNSTVHYNKYILLHTTSMTIVLSMILYLL
eukprot:UN00649